MRRWIEALVRPHRALADWTPSGRATVAVLVVLALASAAGVIAAGHPAVSAVEGTITVENPDHPGQICESMPSASGCDRPATVERSLQAVASGALWATALRAAIGPIAWALLLAGLIAVIRAGGGDDGEAIAAFATGGSIAAVAALPGLLRALARPLTASIAVPTETGLDAVAAAVVEGLAPTGPVWWAIVAVSSVWTGAIVAGALHDRVESAWTAVAVGGLAAAAVLPWPLPLPAESVGPLLGGLFFVGGLTLLLGTNTYLYVEKELSLIGYRGRREVEPTAGWRGLHRTVGLLAVGVGYLLAGLSLFV